MHILESTNRYVVVYKAYILDVIVNVRKYKVVLTLLETCNITLQPYSNDTSYSISDV